ncbi:NAD-dependent epimerase/dehydratase family protein [Candidatus Pacearchaeota archaeon]|nr:NAD-dependent epimerase/dehydratase family protein [Candidatus Pacearchaeota archaeon]
MKILLTGGAGFIGSHVADRFIELGYDVVIVDNLSSGKRQNINKKAGFYEADITDSARLKEIFEKEKPDIVNHHAAQAFVSKSVSEPQFDAKVNIIGTLNLLELSVKNNVKKFIYANSGGAGYGEPLCLPMGEEHSINPMSPYGISKHTAEHYVALYRHLYNLPYVSLRYANVYGPRQDPYGEGGVIAIFTNKLLKGEAPSIFGDGAQTRDYVYVKDVVSANVLALESKEAENKSFNVGTGKNIQTQEIFDKLNALTKANQKPVYRDERKGDLKASSLDSSKLQKLGWKPSYDLDKGLKETADYFKGIQNKK